MNTAEDNHLSVSHEYRQALHELAQLYGVYTEYTASDGKLVTVSDSTLLKTLAELGVLSGTAREDLGAAILAFHNAEASRPLPRCVVATHGYPYVFHVHVHDGAPATVSVRCENKEVFHPRQVENNCPAREVDGVLWGEASFELPADLPLGWHSISLESDGVSASTTLVCVPQTLETAPAAKVAGVMAQLYSVRSTQSWGIGDFADLALLAQQLGTDGFDFLLTNPLHAAEPFPPVEDSPYLPTSRRFVNPIYLHIEDIPEFLALDESTRTEINRLGAQVAKDMSGTENINRDSAYAAKLAALREVFYAGLSTQRQADFHNYIDREGPGLVDFASWCVDQDITRAANDPQRGIHAATEISHHERTQLTEFYMWLQFLCDEQLAKAQRVARDSGMKLGLINDLAVGIHPGGADAMNDAKSNFSVLAPAASVGAPPDDYNQQGQDWSQPPWHPWRLAESGYLPWRELLRTVLRHSGGIRVDHILGLFRLYWIPRGESPHCGTYVRYDHDALVGILALEAQRAGAVVIGEDLGTVESWVRTYLSDRGIMGTSVVWFESSDDKEATPRAQDAYPRLSFTSIGTHDLPPTAGYLIGEHIALRERLGILETDAASEEEADLEWQNQILERARLDGCLSGLNLPENFQGAQRDQRGEISDLIVALTRFTAGTPSQLVCTSLVDMVGDVRTQNQPGTTKDLYPNWCVPLRDYSGKAVLLEQLAKHPLYQAVVHAAQRKEKED